MKNSSRVVIVFLVVFGLSIMVNTAQATNKEKIDLTGDWYLVVLDSKYEYLFSGLNTDIKGHPTYALQQDGNKLIGTGKTKHGDLKLQGTISGNDIEMTGTAGKLPVKFEGNAVDGEIDGKLHFVLEEATFMMKRK